MLKRWHALAAVVLVVVAGTVGAAAPVHASPAEEYAGPYFGENNFPPGCIRNMSRSNPDNICHHMRTDLNGLDSPQVDVVVLVPVSPTAERDMRIMRQSVEMWEAGIDSLARDMGLGWLADGMDFHVTVDYVDPVGSDGGEFTTYPIVDPEIVVIASNPVGGIGIGVDPVDLVFFGEGEVPCHNVSNPFDFEYWESLPGFDSHHGERTGTYVEDCGGAGGNVCFAINGAIDPAPEQLDVFNLFDLVSHEFGHCLTIGHVGDGAEGAWGVVPTNDIMAYSQDPADGNKCVSTLDVEGVALRMSKYLDTNADGAVDDDDLLLANDQIGEGSNPFQVQHPGDHLYASGTGSPLDCPQPDLGLAPGARTNWTPAPVQTTQPVLTLASPEDGAVSGDEAFSVSGTVEHASPNPEPTEPTGSHDDPDDDATTPLTEILALDVAVTPTHVDATIHLEELWPSTAVASGTSYSLVVDGRQFDSFVRYPIDSNPKTWDAGAGAYMANGSSSWDLDANTVTFHLPRDYLAGALITAPYFVGSRANLGSLLTPVVDDSAPEVGDSIGVSGARVIDVPGIIPVDQASTVVEFEHEGGNTFHPEDTSLGVTQDLGVDSAHTYQLEVPETSLVEFTLDWSDDVGGTDLDLFVTGAADSGSEGATSRRPESVVLADVSGTLDIRVDPFLVTDVDGVTYTLTATITASDLDTDGDGVPDTSDACPLEPGNGSNGCLFIFTEHVRVYVDDALAGSQGVDTRYGADAFDLTVTVPAGEHQLRVDWVGGAEVVATKAVNVTTA